MKFIALLLLSVSLSAIADDQHVYLLAKVKIKDTTFASIVFLYEKDIKDLQSCERNLLYGHQGNWQYYRHFVKKSTGFAKSVNYFCVQTDKIIDSWYDNAKYDYVYLVDLRKNELKIKLTEHYSDCMSLLRKEQEQESHKFFCSRANQKVIDRNTDA